MGKITASITISVDGYVAGPDDGPDRGLGTGGERLHHWVFGGPWTYGGDMSGGPTGEDKAWMDEATARQGAVITGRATYEAAGHWGDRNPWGVPAYVVTHRPEEQPDGDEFVFVGSLEEAFEQARALGDYKNVNVMGGAQMIRQALEGGHVDELSIIIAPVVLGGGKRLFEGFERDIELEHLGVRQSPYATFIDYRVVR